MTCTSKNSNSKKIFFVVELSARRVEAAHRVRVSPAEGVPDCVGGIRRTVPRIVPKSVRTGLNRLVTHGRPVVRPVPFRLVVFGA